MSSYVTSRKEKAAVLPGLPSKSADTPKPPSAQQQTPSTVRQTTNGSGAKAARKTGQLDLVEMSAEKRIQYNVRQAPTLYNYYDSLKDEAKRRGHKLSVTEIQNAVLAKNAPTSVDEAIDLCWSVELELREARGKQG